MAGIGLAEVLASTHEMVMPVVLGLLGWASRLSLKRDKPPGARDLFLSAVAACAVAWVSHGWMLGRQWESGLVNVLTYAAGIGADDVIAGIRNVGGAFKRDPLGFFSRLSGNRQGNEK